MKDRFYIIPIGVIKKQDENVWIEIFEKYQATGNDFILIDNRQKSFPDQLDLIPRLCDRRFGIGSDGLILILQIIPEGGDQFVDLLFVGESESGHGRLSVVDLISIGGAVSIRRGLCVSLPSGTL